MAYSEKLAARVRKAFANTLKVEEKVMFGSVCFMVNGKMCVCVGKDELMCRVNPESADTALQKNDTRPMIHNERIIKRCIFVKEKAIQTQKDFDYWINLSLEFNKNIKSSKNRK